MPFDRAGECMKITDLIKRFEEIGYDQETEFAVCVIHKSDKNIKLYEDLNIEEKLSESTFQTFL